MAGIPEHILRRSAEARAAAEGRDVEEVLAEMKGEAAPEPAPAEPEPAAPQPAAAAPAKSSAGIPDAILRRSAEARAKREGRDVEEVFAELKGEAAPAPAAAPAETAPAAAPAAAAATAAPPAATNGGRDLAAESTKFGVPETLLRRARSSSPRLWAARHRSSTSSSRSRSTC